MCAARSSGQEVAHGVRRGPSRVEDRATEAIESVAKDVQAEADIVHVKPEDTLDRGELSRQVAMESDRTLRDADSNA